LHGVGARVYPVGRLDYASEGLILLTNDGELTNLMMKAASHVPKTYMVKVAGTPSSEGLGKLRTGLTIRTDKGKRVRTAPVKINTIRESNNPWYEVTLIEGKNRQIRRMFEEIGHHVEKIKRVRYGSLRLDVEPGKFRELTAQEVAALRTSKPRPAQSVAPRSAAKSAARFIGKARVQRRDQERFRSRREGAPTQEEQGRHAKPKFGRRGEAERTKFAPRGERQAAGQEKPRESQQQGFQRDSRGPRKFNRGERRSEGRGPRSRSKH